MKKIFMIVAALVLVLGLAVSCGKNSGIRTLDEIKESGKIVMVTDAAWAPFEYIADSETPVGADIDLATEIANSLGVELEIINATFDTISNYLESGEADMALAAITITDERKETMLFSEPYTIAQQYIITMENDDTVETIEDLAGKKIGVHLGTTGDFLVSDEVNGYEDEDGNPVTGVLQDTGAEVFQYKNLTEAALAMKTETSTQLFVMCCWQRIFVLLTRGLNVLNCSMKTVQEQKKS